MRYQVDLWKPGLLILTRCSSAGGLAPDSAAVQAGRRPGTFRWAPLDAGFVAFFFVDDADDSTFERWAVGEFLDVVDERCAVDGWALPLWAHTNCVNRARFFAETAEDAAEHIDLVSYRKFLDGWIV